MNPLRRNHVRITAPEQSPSTQSGERNATPTGSRKQPHARTRSGGHAAFIQNLPSANLQSQSDSSWGLAEGPGATAQSRPAETSARLSRRFAIPRHRLSARVATAILSAAVIVAAVAAWIPPAAQASENITSFKTNLAEEAVIAPGTYGEIAAAGTISEPPVSGAESFTVATLSGPTVTVHVPFKVSTTAFVDPDEANEHFVLPSIDAGNSPKVESGDYVVVFGLRSGSGATAAHVLLTLPGETPPTGHELDRKSVV